MTGSAQKRSDNFFLQHGSIPVDLDLKDLFSALDTAGKTSPERGIELLGKSVGWLNRWIDDPVTVDRVEDDLISTFVSLLDIDLLETPLTDSEWARTKELVNEKYGNQEWNLKDIV